MPTITQVQTPTGCNNLVRFQYQMKPAVQSVKDK